MIIMMIMIMMMSPDNATGILNVTKSDSDPHWQAAEPHPAAVAVSSVRQAASRSSLGVTMRFKV